VTDPIANFRRAHAWFQTVESELARVEAVYAAAIDARKQALFDVGLSLHCTNCAAIEGAFCRMSGVISKSTICPQRENAALNHLKNMGLKT